MINIKPILLREQIIKSVRAFFYAHHFHEVIVPVLNKTVPLESNLFPFSTQWETRTGTQTLYLSTSPERRLKQMIAGGLDNCFAIQSSFRNLENSGTLHTPEFLMLEWYRKNVSYIEIMDETEKLIIHIDKQLQKLSPVDTLKANFLATANNKWKKISLISLFSDLLQINLNKIIENEKLLFEIAKKKGYNTKNTTWEELYDQVFVNEIESHLPHEPIFLIDFPSRISPLCKPKNENDNFAQRFELYINRIEIANGNTENTDTKSIENHFNKIKRAKSQPIDQEFLASIKKIENSSFAGIGLGIDRLTMLFSGSKTIDELGTLT